MNQAKIFIAFTFLLTFAFQVSAQNEKPKIVWKNLQEKYESFYDINPNIVNVSNEPIYYTDNWAASFEYFDTEKNLWRENLAWSEDGPIIKQKTYKLNPNTQTQVFGKAKDWFNWYGILCCDDVFKNFVVANQTAKYRLTVGYFYGKKSLDRWIYSRSPEFEVTVKDFKKYFL